MSRGVQYMVVEARVERNDCNGLRAETRRPHAVRDRMEDAIMDRLLLLCHPGSDAEMS
jgi:hypothetical protein